MHTQDILFSRGELRQYLANIESKINSEIELHDSEYLLNINLQDFVYSLASQYEIEPLSLKETEIYVKENEVEVDISQDSRRLIIDRSRPFYIKATQINYIVPYDGEGELFRYGPSSLTYNHPSAEIRSNEIVIKIIDLDNNPDKIKHDFQQTIDEIKRWLGWVKTDINQFNEGLKNKIENRVNQRRDKFLGDQKLVTSLGYPIKRREDSIQTYSVPQIKRKIISKPTATMAPTTPEPALNSEEYENILKIVSNMTQVMERTPKAFIKMDEENLRTHFLVQLNGHYEGNATGETFNFEGKTDILIRENGKNIFIAECAFWKGPGYLIEKLNQILKYTSWRDTKTAILIFNRTRDLSNVLSKIQETVPTHPNFKRKIEYKNETGFRFILNHRDDKERNLTLTILVFEVPQ